MAVDFISNPPSSQCTQQLTYAWESAREIFFKVDDVALLQKAAKRCRKFGRYEAYVTASYRRDNASSPEVCYHFDDNEFL